MWAADHIEPIEKASIDEIRALQVVRLKDALSRAYERVPPYKRKFDAARVRPDGLERLEDIVKFPFTTKDDLRANYPFGMFAAPTEEIVRIHASSGTTGRPTVVRYTKKDIETWAWLMALDPRCGRNLAG